MKPAIQSAIDGWPVMAVVRTDTLEEAERQARVFLRGGIRLLEITFSVPDAPALVERLLAERGADDEHFVGMGTVTNEERARRAVAAGAEFIVSPNVSAAVAAVAREAGRYLVLGGLTATELVTARELGSDLVKVYPLPPVGGPRYLSTVRQPIFDVPMLAGGGFGIDEIPAYRQAGATAFGIGAPLLGATDEETIDRVQRALRLARGADS